MRSRCWLYLYVLYYGLQLSAFLLTCDVTAGLGYIRYIAPPEWALRWIEAKLNLLAILPHYVSVDQKTYGRFGVLPTSSRSGGSPATELVGSSQRVGP